MDEKTEKIKRIIEKLFEQYRIPKSNYSIGESKEDAFCIAQKGDDWYFFTVERGNEYDYQKADNLEDACHVLINHVLAKDDRESALEILGKMLDMDSGILLGQETESKNSILGEKNKVTFAAEKAVTSIQSLVPKRKRVMSAMGAKKKHSKCAAKKRMASVACKAKRVVGSGRKSSQRKIIT